MIPRITPNQGTFKTFDDYLPTASARPVNPDYRTSGFAMRTAEENILMAENRSLRDTEKVFGSTGITISDQFKNMLPLILVFLLLVLVIFKR